MSSMLKFMVSAIAIVGVIQVAKAQDATATPVLYSPSAPLCTGAPSRQDLAKMQSDIKAKNPWSEFAAVAAALQDINHDFLARAVFLAQPEQVDVSERDDQHMPMLKAKTDKPDTAEITLNLFPLDPVPVLSPIAFVPGDADESKVYWQRALLAAFQDEAVGKKLKETAESRKYHPIPEGDTPGDANRAMAFLEMLTGVEAEVLEKEGTSVEDMVKWISPQAEYGPGLPFDGRVQLDYNPTIVCDKDNKIRVVRPVHLGEGEYSVACPVQNDEHFVENMKQWLDKQKDNDAQQNPDIQKRQADLLYPSPHDFKVSEQKFRLLDPAAGRVDWERTGLTCSNVDRYFCDDQHKDQCDGTIDDQALYDSMIWIIRLNPKDITSDSGLKIGDGLKALL